MNKLKLKILKKIGLSPYSPRWIKVICLRITMREIRKGFSKLFKSSFENITPEERDKINKLILDMNTARGACHDKS